MLAAMKIKRSKARFSSELRLAGFVGVVLLLMLAFVLGIWLFA